MAAQQVPVDPWSAGFMALGSVASAASQPGGPSQAAFRADTSFDNSGFVVNVGTGQASSTKTALPSASQALGAAGAATGQLLSNPIFMVAVGVGLFLFLKRRK